MRRGFSGKKRVWLAGFAAAFVAAGVGATLALSARAERRYPPQGAFVEVEGLRLRYARAGAGRAVVLLHGAFGGLEDFRATLFDDLAARADVLAFDRPGSGYSERASGRTDPAEQARLLHAAARTLGLERPILVGFSFGAAVALAWALEWPEDCAAVVTVSGAVMPWHGSPNPSFVLAGLPLLGWLATHTVIEPLGAWLSPAGVRRACAPQPVPAAFAASPVALALRPASFRANAEDMRLLDGFLSGQCLRYPDLQVPVVIVVGAQDRVASAALHSRGLAALAPRVELREVPDGGHQILYTHTAEVLAAVERAFEIAP